MNVLTNSGKLFTDELIQWLIKSDSIQYHFQMSIYYKYAPDGTNIVVLSCVDDFIYWYTSEAPGEKMWAIQERYSMWTSWDMHID